MDELKGFMLSRWDEFSSFPPEYEKLFEERVVKGTADPKLADLFAIASS